MIKQILSTVALVSITSLSAQTVLVTECTAQQVLETSYAGDEFNTTGNLISVTGTGKVKVTKMIEEGYLEVKFDSLFGGSDNDHINIAFQKPLDMTDPASRKIRMKYECNQSFMSSIAFGNVSWGPFAQSIHQTGILIFDLGSDAAELLFTNPVSPSNTKLPFNAANITNAFFILNPTYTAPTYTTGEKILPGILKIFSLQIGAGELPSASEAEMASNTNAIINYNSNNKIIQYENVSNTNTKLLLFDAMGRLMTTNTISNSGTIDATALGLGLYHAHLVTDNNKKTFKLLIQ